MRSVERGWLAELDPDTRAAVERLGRVQRYQAGEALFLEGDVGSKVIVIRSGFLKVVATSEDGHATVLAVRGPGDLMGELSAIDEAPRSATGIAMGPVEAQVFSAEVFRRVLADTPGVAIGLLRMLIDRVRDSDQHRVEFGARDTLGRVALRLVVLAETAGEAVEDGVKIGIPLTQEDLAGWIGASREAVARGLASLRNRDLIRTGRKEIIILDLDGLRDAAR